jgi:hypothetical protein
MLATVPQQTASAAANKGELKLPFGQVAGLS